VHAAARATVRGVRLLIDATWAGRWEMGTQVQTVALLEALCGHPDVETVFVALGSELPPTVDAVLANPRLQPRAVLAGDLSGFGEVDVVHRPFQTDGALDIAKWRKVGARTVLTVLDLIGYHVGAYHDSGPHWAAFRRALRTAVSVVDGVVVPAADVANQVRLERLPIEPDRLFEVGLGTDHLTGNEPQSPPPEVVARDLGSRGFLLVLGADYAHKNRDLALRTFAELQRRGFTGGLVMAGPVIPQSKGATRPQSDVDGVLVLPHVRPAERNWLLAHAALVLYPTSAEGFGLVPYEAARFGTPTVLVPVGPLEVVAADLPVLATSWSATAMADAAERLLGDAELAAAQVAAAVDSADRQRWDDTAARLVDVYRTVLARPTVGGPPATS
jgi:glycosyltransferase involved in cell wall biosynthesis